MLQNIQSLLTKIISVGCDKESKEKLLVFLDELFASQYPTLVGSSEEEIIVRTSHYVTEGRKETIVEIYEDVLLEEKDLFNSYCVGNLWKYCSRFSKKNGAEDLKKAKQYAEFLKLTNLRTFN